MEAHLLLEVKPEMIGSVSDFTYKWCVNMGLDRQSAARMALCMDEVLTNITLYAFKDENGYAEVWYQYSPSEIEIIVQEKGEPFDPEKYTYDPDRAIRENDFKGASLEAIRQMADQFLFLNRGKDGKEYRLIKKFHFPHIMEVLPAGYDVDSENQRDKSESEEDFLITPVTVDDAEDIAKLIYRSYSYSYPKEDLYFPRRIETAIRNKYKYGTIVRTVSGRPVGYFAVVKSTDSMIGEVTEAVVSPAYRNRGLMKKMMLNLIEMSRQEGLAGLFGMAITNHLFSQKVNAKYGFKSTALIISKSGRRRFKAMEKSFLDMISVVLDFLPLTDHWHKPPVIPEAYTDLLSGIYAQFDEPELSASPNAPYSSRNEKTDMSLSINYESRSALIVVKTYGAGFVESFNRMLKSTEDIKLTSIYIDLPMDDPYINKAITRVKEMGFILSGLMPFFHQEKDFLRMQKLYREINFDDIETFSDCAGQLKNIIRNEYAELQEIGQEA
ncbi:MAG: GNAT family N-acetyltransferase [Balneolaceae bacterium]|nr:GNAT family N-acetyltransferase [Balneolaceae bacterium]